jgi:hypothetical protein
MGHGEAVLGPQPLPCGEHGQARAAAKAMQELSPMPGSAGCAPPLIASAGAVSTREIHSAVASSASPSAPGEHFTLSTVAAPTSSEGTRSPGLFWVVNQIVSMLGCCFGPGSENISVDPTGQKGHFLVSKSKLAVPQESWGESVRGRRRARPGRVAHLEGGRAPARRRSHCI